MQDLQTSFNNKRILAKNLPTLPLALQEAMRLADNPQTTATQFAAVIGRDQVLSSKVLRMVNSAAYGFPGRIASIQNALVLLGFNVVKSLIISTVVFESMTGSMKGLWRHSVGCSIACNELGRLLKMESRDELFIAGLLHDIGKVVTAVQLPEAQQEIDRLVREEDLPCREAEECVLGMTHTHIGSWLAEHWNLPANLRHALAHHHRPMSNRADVTIASIVHAGDFLTRLFEFGNGGDDHAPALNPHVFKHLELNQRKLGMVMDTIGEKFEQEGTSLF
jgi:HD-like signal output (HDOD) protein